MWYNIYNIIEANKAFGSTSGSSEYAKTGSGLLISGKKIAYLNNF